MAIKKIETHPDAEELDGRLLKHQEMVLKEFQDGYTYVLANPKTRKVKRLTSQTRDFTDVQFMIFLDLERFQNRVKAGFKATLMEPTESFDIEPSKVGTSHIQCI
jgi:hypothetical protein